MTHDAQRLSRRALLVASMAAGAVAAGVRRAFAEEKIKKKDALYQDQPHGQQRCEICLQFRPPNQCALVEGEISPKGYCQFFAAKENAH
jgi:hypothetical protein